MSESAELAVETVGIGRRYGRVTALEAVNLRVASGSYFVLLGPSGGGKTTLLRLVGGLVRPSAGRVLLHGRDMTDSPANERPTTMVFQSYALFPHMSVARNVGFGLELKRVPKRELRDRVDRMLELVGLAGYNERMPHELSGGQQQRVQLARSLVLDRDVLLLDEPLAALDEKLRKEMCLELKRIQEQVGITFIHVTHNQEEAMTVADRIAVIAGGRLVEEGSPREIYERPTRRFTAEFIGEARLFDGTIAAVDGKRARVDIGIGTVEVEVRDANVREGSAVAVSIRSELLELLAPDATGDSNRQSLPATYERTIYLGLTSSHRLRLSDGSEVGVRRLSGGREATRIEPGSSVRLAWRLEDARLHAV